MSTNADAWFHNAILEGMQALQVLALPSSPPADAIGATAVVWVDALWRRANWREERDLARLREAFVSVAGSVERWPAPHVLLAHMPAIREQALLARPKQTPEDHAEAIRRLGEVRRRYMQSRQGRKA